MVFCNIQKKHINTFVYTVTILILVDGFLQYCPPLPHFYLLRHNPYFSRWFSAMQVMRILTVAYISHNPYFSRWFSAMNRESITLSESDVLSQSLF